MCVRVCVCGTGLWSIEMIPFKKHYNIVIAFGTPAFMLMLLLITCSEQLDFSRHKLNFYNRTCHSKMQAVLQKLKFTI